MESKKEKRLIKCLLCDKEILGDKRFTVHLQMSHKMKSDEYTWKHLMKLQERPRCAKEGCCDDVRYVSFSYKKYCKLHGKLAMSEAGAVGGKIKKTWNKDKTKFEDERIAKFAESQKGENNHFFGKKHSEQSLEKMRVIKRLDISEVNDRIIQKNSEWKLLSDLSCYESRQEHNLDWECTKCGKQETFSFMYLERDYKCKACHK
jgi:hypothetical protein